MPIERDKYEILDLPRTATVAEIKKRYRELVHKFHPDVAVNKEWAASMFGEVTEAYKTLVDKEKRRAYDATIVDKTQRFHPGADRIEPHGAAGPARSAAPKTPADPRVRQLVKDAELAFIKRKPNKAAALCKEAIGLDSTCARAHAILGDIYRSRHRTEHAINEYSFAVQFNPADRDSEKKLEKLLEHVSPVRFSWDTPEGKMSREAVLLNVIAWSSAFFLLFLLRIYPGKPIPMLAGVHIPFFASWSWNLVGIMFGDGILVGFLLGINGLTEHPDEELIFESSGRGVGLVATGILLLVFPPFFFLGAAGIYLLLSFLQDTTSKSVCKVFAAVMAIVLISALVYPGDHYSVFLMGGNVVFVGTLIGWYLGAIARG